MNVDSVTYIEPDNVDSVTYTEPDNVDSLTYTEPDPVALEFEISVERHERCKSPFMD
jgi:hypothetical protein